MLARLAATCLRQTFFNYIDNWIEISQILHDGRRL